MTITPMSIEEQANSGFTHKSVITYTDLVAAGATTSTVATLATYAKGHYLAGGAFYMPTVFTDGAATLSNLKLDVGWNGASVDDPDGCLDNYELEATDTEIFCGDANGAAFATLRTGIAFQEAGTIEVTFTATGANLSTLTAGEVRIFLKLVDLTKF